jgi:signal transduction histidine kinase
VASVVSAGTLPRRSVRIPAGIAGGVAVVAGGVVLTGWVTRRPELIQLRAGQVPVQFNTALCLALLGVALLLMLTRWVRAAVAPLAVVTFWGVGTLAEYVTGRAIGIDRLLFDPWLTIGTDAPGRMARNTAICFTTLGATAIWLALSRRRSTPSALAVGTAASLVAGLALVALFGYAADVAPAYTWRTSTAMAPLTAVLLLLLAIGYIAAAWGTATAGGGTPRWLPVPVGVGALAATLFLWQALTSLGTNGTRTISLDRAAGGVLAIGLVFSALLALATSLGQHARRRRLVAEGLAAKLEEEAARRLAFQDVLVRRTGRDAVLRAAYLAVATATDLREGFDAFAGAVSSALRFDRATLSVVDGDETTIVAVCGKDMTALPVGSAVSLSDPLLDAILEARGPYLQNDIAAAFGEHAVRLGVRSCVAAPVVVTGQPRALLSFAATDADSFSPEDLVIVGELVNVVGGALYTLARLEDERETTARLRELDALKNEFVGVVAHDLRSPMTVIAGYVDTVLQRWDDLPDEMKRDLLGVASRNTKRLSVLVEDVLQVARIESGDFPYEIAPFDLGALVCRTVDEMNAARDDRNVVADVPADLPTALGDEDRQWRVLTNLISNAQKFSPPEYPIRVSVSVAGDLLEVRVSDRGPGIPPEDLPRLFGKFSRLATPSGGEKGTGLGLYICRALVEAQGGEIGADSHVGTGTTLRYTVPRARSVT